MRHIFNLFIGMAVLSTPLHSFAETQIDFISGEKISALSTAFDQSQRISQDQIQKLNSTSWSCTLYGVKSQMQKSKSIELYAFDVKSNVALNAGAQEVRQYQSIDGELTGTNHRITDKIRFYNSKQLITKLHLKNHELPLAFATCNKSLKSAQNM